MTPEQQRALVRARARLRLQQRQQQAEQPQQPQRSPQYTQAYQQRADARRARTPEELRTGRVPGGGRDIPVPDFLQGFAGALQNFNRSGPAEMNTQMFRNLGVTDDLAYWATRPQGREQARAAQQYEQDRQQQVAREQPILNTASIVASIPATGGNPTAAAGRIGAVQAGAAAAGTNLPFAFARQDGNFQERLPGALQETAAVGALGATLQGAANRLLRPSLPNSAAARVQEFDQAGVRAPLAAIQGRGSAPMAMAISENPIGGNVRRNLQNSVDDVQNAYRGMVNRAGNAEPREIAGEMVQRGVRRFANGRNEPMPNQMRIDPATGRSVPATPRQIPTRDWSFGAKSESLYDDVFGRLARDEEQLLRGGVRNHLDTTATRDVLREIINDVSGTASRDAMSSPMINTIRRAIVSDARDGTLRFQDLRRWRTWVREAQADEGLRQGMSNAALQRIEGALTEDIYTSARQIGGQAAHDLHVTDRWYRQTMNRINTALEPFNTTSSGVPTMEGARSFRRVIDLASQGGRQNTRQLEQLRTSLRPDEWRSVSASIMDELGNPSFGNPNIMERGAFSLEHFVTNVGRMSDEGRRSLFGPQMAAELERLARVAGSLKAVRGFTNFSRSGSSIQNMSTFGLVGTAAVSAGTGNVAPMAGLIATGLAARITGEMLTNPAFVRWLTTPGGGGLRRQLALLATIAARDPAVAPLYADLAAHVTDRSRAPANQPAERSQSLQ